MEDKLLHPSLHDRARKLQTEVEAAQRQAKSGELADEALSQKCAQLHDRAVELKAESDRADEEADMHQQLADLSRELGFRSGPARMPGQSSLGGDGKDFGWTAEITKQAFPWNAKELVAPGSAIVSTPLLPGVTAEPQRATHVTDLIPTRPLQGPTFSFLRQIERELNAAPVQLGKEKPVSKMQLEQVVGGVATIAHLTEPIPKQWLSDSQAVERFVRSELLYGLLVAVDAAVLHGYTREDGVDEEGLLTSSGHVLQEFDTDVFTTMRRAALALEGQDLVATAAVMSPIDFAAAELAQNEIGQYKMSDPGRQLPLDSARRTLWGLPVMTTTAIAAGTALVLNSTEAALIMSRETATVTWSENVGDDFTSNLLRYRAELRLGLCITRPNAVVEVQLSESAGG